MILAVSKKQVDMLLRVLPCSVAVCYAFSVQLEGVGGEGFELSHLLLKHSSVNKMLVAIGKQTMLLVEIWWQHTLRQRHWEWCGHLQLHKVWAGLCMCCKNMLRQFQNYLAGWLQSDLIKGMEDSSWYCPYRQAQPAVACPGHSAVWPGACSRLCRKLGSWAGVHPDRTCTLDTSRPTDASACRT